MEKEQKGCQMFKKKNIKKEDIKKPAPILIDIFGEYRLVLDSRHTGIEVNGKPIEYVNQLILERKEYNTLKEPYYTRDCEDCRYIVSNYRFPTNKLFDVLEAIYAERIKGLR